MEVTSWVLKILIVECQFAVLTKLVSELAALEYALQGTLVLTPEKNVLDASGYWKS